MNGNPTTTSNASGTHALSRRSVLSKEEIRALLGDAGFGLAFESDAGDAPSESREDSWHPISREVMAPSSLVLETAALPVKFGCLVRCVIYSSGESATVQNVSMEFVPNARIHREVDPESGQTRHRLA
ncbi:hypothetical protein [Salidesulfovibrio onnuriiensis]|uniref:hypothetical protein n=1 Tax=Salidesulfovibrio onnuriiensis TaxID=2583823 RepID=UPI0011CAD3CE|nr:hypothetical protein [Salidesulfovibrio onnuriiensis]